MVTLISLTSYLIASFPFPLGVLLGILGGGVLPGSSNPNVILDQKMYLGTTNTFIHYRSSLVNHIRFQTKMGKIQTKTAPKLYTLSGGTYLYGLLVRE